MNKDKCATCGTTESENGFYEYRGFIFCEPHFDEGIEKVDRKRGEVMEVTEASITSQRNGEFMNNRGKYHLGNVASDGLPIMNVKEPQILKDYESGVL
jgi:recombinational DNA repair protein (RecF pathway)